jgi:hypothetical protein
MAGTRITYDQSFDAHVDKGVSGENIKNLFLDSGAYGLYVRNVMPTGNYKFYDSIAFWEYVDRYAKFIKAYRPAFDHYANVDVIGDPERSYEVQKYLEETHALSPVPAVHFGTSVEWLQRYLREGYPYIAFGGLAFRRKAGRTRESEHWLDQMFHELCPASNNHRPLVKVHGFGVTSFRMMSRYPWTSVDSTSYFKAAGFTGVYVPPRKKDGSFDFAKVPFHLLIGDRISAKVQNPYHIRFFQKSKLDGVLGKVRSNPNGKMKSIHAKAIYERVEEWAKYIDIPMGKRGSDGEVIQPGITNNTVLRMRANVIYFGLFEKHFKTPTTFCHKRQNSLGLFD